MKLFEVAMPQSLIVSVISKLLSEEKEVYLEITATKSIIKATPVAYRKNAGIPGQEYTGYINSIEIIDDANSSKTVVCIEYMFSKAIGLTDDLYFYADMIDNVLTVEQDEHGWKLVNS
jgi:hypothetical protein